MTDDGRRGYVLTEDDVNSIADLVTAGDPRAMQVPNGTVAVLIARLRKAEVETLRRPVMVLQVDADLSEGDVARLRARYAEAVAADPRPVWTVASEEVRAVEWTLGDDYAPYDSSRVYSEADARMLAADPDSASVLWRREATAWRKAEADGARSGP